MTTKGQLFTINHLDGIVESEVAKDENEVKHECVYLGPHEETKTQPVDQRQIPPSTEFARGVALSILGGARGKVHPSSHCREMMVKRNFDVFDMEYAIRNGKCVGTGEYCEEHRNHKYVFRGMIDGVEFDAVFALSVEHDYVKSPLMVLVTGCWKTKTGRRSKTY